jgi:hypothetical protein
MAAADPPARLVLLDPNAPGPFPPRITLATQDLGTMSPDEVLAATRLQMKAQGDRVLVERDEALGGSPGGHLFEFVAFTGSGALRGRQRILFQGSGAYLLTALAPSHQFEAYRVRFETAFGSVALSSTGRE